jgi:hypothetical protein
VESVCDLGGGPQVYRVDADLFRELLQARRLGEYDLRAHFKADLAHFLFAAARKLSKQGPSSAPIYLTLADLLR